MSETTAFRAAGIDGCRGGWIMLVLEPVPADAAESTDSPSPAPLRLSSHAWELLPAGGLDRLFAPPGTERRSAGADAHPILIDIPIGLPDAEPREADRLARTLLGRRASSVFSVPVRRAVFAEDYREACDANRADTGKGISRQSWNICPKIRETDRLLADFPGSSERLLESHPELCFAVLNAGTPAEHPKKRVEGCGERLDLLSKFLPSSPALFREALGRFPRSRVGRDDLVDALVLAVGAVLIRRYGAVSLPPVPPRDATGLPMRIAVPAASR